MEDYQIKKIGNILANFVEALGMQAENMQRKTLGESMAYDSNDFHRIAEDIKFYAGE